MASTEDHNNSKEQNASSPASLLASAKVVAEAAQTALRHDPQNLDKAKAADAAADLLDAGSHYTKVDQSGYGKYVDKAEDYLHHIKPDAPTAAASAAAEDSKEVDKNPTAAAGEPEKKEAGTGDLMKMAQGFLK